MTPPRRAAARPQPRASHRLASMLFGIGCLVVLTATFALGVAAGRRWPSGLPLPGFGGTHVAAPASPVAGGSPPAATPRAERDTARRSESRGFDKDKARTMPEAPPVLTFYHELTAPLSSTPPAPSSVAKREARASETIKSAPRPADPAKPAVSEVAATVEAPRDRGPVSATGIGVPPTVEPRFTVQVGAFKLRSQAEALRTRLAATGQEAYVTEGEMGGVMQYRVRVGAFTTREAARDAAVRLGAERQLATYVTTR
jgi:cell division protein FtsN